MTTIVALLRGVNVGGNNKIKMADLRAVCESMGLQDVRTYIQSGNVVFRTNAANVASRLETAIERAFGFRPPVITRTAAQMRSVVELNPFPGLEPTKLLVSFLGSEPAAEAIEVVRRMEIAPEKIRIVGRDMYIHFPLGQGVSKLPMARIEKALGAKGTARNWNSVMTLLAMAEEL
ncbi:MAG: DUF1697 domain-containing protein [Bryobacteraceae bacterium]